MQEPIQFICTEGRKGLVCVPRYIKDDVIPEPESVKLSGENQEPDGWRFYLGNKREPVRDSWYLDSDRKWYWFNAAGIMVANTWYRYKGDWYYLGIDGAMIRSLKYVDGKSYYLDEYGKMATKEVVLTQNQDGALQYPRLAE